MATKAQTTDANGLVEMAWDPITRIVGSLGIYTKIDFGKGKVAECHSTSSIFRGYSIFMKGKDPRDAHFITSRICGICGDNHATCSCYAQNMAYGVHPPALGEQIVNLGEAAEYMFDHNIFQENLVGVDFCEKMVAETNPGVLEQANRTESPHAAEHGYKTIGDIMRSLNPFSGEFYREALQVSRYTREMFCLMEGRHVHPSTLYPGGVGTTATIQLFTDYYTRLMRYVEFMKRVVPMHDDLFDFFYQAMPGYEEVGPAPHPARLLGRLPGPGRVQLQLPGHDQVGPGHGRHPGRRRRRQAGDQRPGRHQPGHPHPARPLVLRRLGRPGDVRDPATPSGNPVDRRHPWNQHTNPQPQKRDFDGKYSWVMSPRWFDGTGPPGPRHRRRPAGPAVVDGPVRPGRHRPPEGDRHQRARSTCPRRRSSPRSTFEWKVPQWSNTIERDRARTYFQAYAAAAALDFIEKALADVRAGKTKTWEPFEVPDEGIGCGFTEAVRGVLSHHMVIKGGKIANYHPYPPTPWNANPRDIYGTPGPYEDAVIDTPDLRGERPASTSRASTSCGRSAASTRACRAGSTCTWARARC